MSGQFVLSMPRKNRGSESNCFIGLWTVYTCSRATKEHNSRRMPMSNLCYDKNDLIQCLSPCSSYSNDSEETVKCIIFSHCMPSFYMSPKTLCYLVLHECIGRGKKVRFYTELSWKKRVNEKHFQSVATLPFPNRSFDGGDVNVLRLEMIQMTVRVHRCTHCIIPH